MIRLAVAGAAGRTGRCVVERAVRDDRFALVAALGEPEGGRTRACLQIDEQSIPIVESLGVDCDVLVDFTLPAGTMAWLDVCLERRIPLVTGVTGHDDRQRERLRDAAKRLPILQAANFSIGINVMLEMIGDLATRLGERYDVEIIETHHKKKIDAPSGTAGAIAAAIRSARGSQGGDEIIHGRSGSVGERPLGQIGIHSVRMGDLVGSHEIHFSGPGETVTIKHTAHSRHTFAAGALRAAAWIVGKEPGSYAMSDVIG